MQFSRRRVLTFLLGLTLAALNLSAYAAKTEQVALKTSEGDIVLELYPEKAPKTVANFLRYVKAGHYTNTIFHRVINGFMIQGGGFDTAMKEKPAMSHVQNEANNGLKNEPYSLAMARTPDPHSAGAQFFINVNDNSFLNYPGQDGWGYCVFGKVIRGMDIVDKIKSVNTTVVNGMPDVPAKQVVITSAVIKK
jgi:cyclophilin family peptidyl-prolyl cis-trans isomerase